MATAKTLTIALNVNANAAPAVVVRANVRKNMKNFSTDLCKPIIERKINTNSLIHLLAK